MGIHSSATIEDGAKFGENVSIGANVFIGKNTILGDNVTIQNGCEIGTHTFNNDKPLIIGSNSLIRSQSIFYNDSIFGDYLITGHRVTVREKIRAGNNLQLGTLTDLQGDCTIGNYVRTHSNVHIAKYSKIGNFVWMFPYVVLTNDPHPPSYIQRGVVIEDYVAISTMSVILPGVRVRKDTLVGAKSLVSKNTNEGTLVAGNPAKEICPASLIRLKEGVSEPAYPWRRHFHRGYPVDLVNSWKAEFHID